MKLTLPEDRDMVTAANVARFSFCGTAADLRARAEALAADGVTERALQPGGDVPSCKPPIRSRSQIKTGRFVCSDGPDRLNFRAWHRVLTL